MEITRCARLRQSGLKRSLHGQLVGLWQVSPVHTVSPIPEVATAVVRTEHSEVTAPSSLSMLLGHEVAPARTEVPRVLFLGICLNFYYSLLRVLLPQFGFHFDQGSVSQALMKPCLVPP